MKRVIFFTIFIFAAIALHADVFAGVGYSPSYIVADNDIRISHHIPLRVGYYSDIENNSGGTFSGSFLIPVVETIYTSTDSISLPYDINYGLSARAAYWRKVLSKKNGTFSMISVGVFAEYHLSLYQLTTIIPGYIEYTTDVIHQRFYAGPSISYDTFSPVGGYGFFGLSTRYDISFFEKNSIITSSTSAADTRGVLANGLNFSIFFTQPY